MTVWVISSCRFLHNASWERPELGSMSAAEMQTNDNKAVIHNDPLNHMEINGLGIELLKKILKAAIRN